jgi:hypothetical protein
MLSYHNVAELRQFRGAYSGRGSSMPSRFTAFEEQEPGGARRFIGAQQHSPESTTEQALFKTP